MKTIKTHKTVVCDIDDTVVMWNKSDYPKEEYITINVYGHNAILVPNKKVINLVKKMAKLGWTVIFWSRTGWEWAEAIPKALGLEKYGTLAMTKPLYYIDDKNADDWMERLWRKP